MHVCVPEEWPRHAGRQDCVFCTTLAIRIVVSWRAQLAMPVAPTMQSDSRLFKQPLACQRGCYTQFSSCLPDIVPVSAQL